MFVYACRRIFLLIPTLLAVSLVVFSILHFVPGDPARTAAGPEASEQDVQIIREKYGLDKPLYIQYGIYLLKLVHGDLGVSFRTRRPVLDELLRRIPATAELATSSMILAVILGVPLGVFSSLRPNTLLDNVITGLASFGISVPIFFLGLVLMLIFAAQLGILPPTGRGTWQQLVLPTATLGFPYVATFARVTRSNMLDVFSEDYIRTARAKGLLERTVIYKHALVNASVPLITLLGVYFGQLLGGAVITETVFAWPGIGRYMVGAVILRDIYVVQGCILTFATAVILVNLVVDLLYGLIDPRITYD